MGPSRRTLRKEKAIRLLREARWAELDRWQTEERHVLSTLIALLLEPDDLLRWRAIDGLGRLAATQASQALDVVRDLVRRQFWAMNDESGGIAWHAPEAIGEILSQVPVLAEEFAAILFSFARTDPFQVGVFWAMARLANTQRTAVLEQRGLLGEALADPRPAIRAYAGLALLALCSPCSKLGAEIDERLAALEKDAASLITYDFSRGIVLETTVGAYLRQGRE